MKKSLGLLSLLFSSVLSPLAEAGLPMLGKSFTAPKAGESVEAYIDRHVERLQGDKRPMWPNDPEDNFIILFPERGNRVIASRLSQHLVTLCQAHDGMAYGLADRRSEPPLKFTRDYLQSTMGVSPALLDQFGSEPQAVVSFTVKTGRTSGLKMPSFGVLQASTLPAYGDQFSRMVDTFPGLSYGQRLVNHSDFSGVCLTATPENARPLFSWYLKGLRQTGQAEPDLVFGLRNAAALEKRLRFDIHEYYKQRLAAIAIEKEVAQVAEENAAQRKAMAAADATRQAELEEARAREARARAKEQAKAQAERSMRAAAFRKSLQEGQDSHCGLVATVKPAVVLVQTMNGPMWLKRNELYPAGMAECRIVNGVYRPDPATLD